MIGKLKAQLQQELDTISQAGLYKKERIIVKPQSTQIEVSSGENVLNFCANNYLGLSSNPEVVQAAKDAFQGWSKLEVKERAQYLRSIGDLLKENAELLGRTETIDSGKLLKETKFATEYVREYFHFYADLAEKMENEFPIPKIDKPDMDVVEVREPIGVVACIIPWNQQMFFFLNN